MLSTVLLIVLILLLMGRIQPLPSARRASFFMGGAFLVFGRRPDRAT